jgi:putative DNA primase/helicase
MTNPSYVKPVQTQKLPEVTFPNQSERPCYQIYEQPFIVKNKAKGKGKEHKQGVYYHYVGNRENKNGGITKALIDRWVTSYLRVISIIRNADGTEHSYLIEYTEHGKPEKKRMIIPQSLLLGSPDEALKMLRDAGVSVLHENVGYVRNYLDKEHLRFSEGTPDFFLRLAKAVGWYDENTFVLPNEVIGEQDKVLFTGRGDMAEYRKKGSLPNWSNKVARYCVGNPYLQVAVSLAFSGPLLKLTGIPGIAIHFFGDSTLGKSTALLVGTSVWFNSKLLSWNATLNGLESQAASRSSTFFPIDESHLADVQHLGAAIYMLLNGVSKSRMNKDATAKAIIRWLLGSVCKSSM